MAADSHRTPKVQIALIRRGQQNGALPYFFLDPDEHITGVQIVTCSSDVEAMAAAGIALQPDKMGEIWHNARRVGRIKASEVALSFDVHDQEDMAAL